MSKKLILSLALVFTMSLVAVGTAFAADITYSVDTPVTFTDSAINFSIQAGSGATSIVFGTATVVVTVPASGSFTVTSSNRTIADTGASDTAYTTTTCNSSNQQTVVISPGAGQAETITLTPGASICSSGSGGGGGGGGGGAPVVTTPVISSFTAASSTISAGASTTLSWSVSNSSSVSINQGIGSVSAAGSTTISPSVTTVYTLTATNSSGSVTSNVTVTVPGTTPAPSSSSGHPNGTLIIDNGTVYLIKDGTRYGFRDAAEYASHGYNFGQAVAANAQDMALPQAVFVQKALEGTLVLDASDNVTVYMIGQNGTKRGFASAAVFTGLGYNFANLPKINVSDYPAGDPITDANLPHPEGALVLNNGTVWWILGGQRQGFESAAVFNTYGFSWGKIVTANAADMALTESSLVKFRDGTLVLDGGAYYLISDGTKKMFTSAADLEARGYKASNAINASLSAYASGGTVQ